MCKKAVTTGRLYNGTKKVFAWGNRMFYSLHFSHLILHYDNQYQCYACYLWYTLFKNLNLITRQALTSIRHWSTITSRLVGGKLLAVPCDAWRMVEFSECSDWWVYTCCINKSIHPFLWLLNRQVFHSHESALIKEYFKSCCWPSCLKHIQCWPELCECLWMCIW